MSTVSLKNIYKIYDGNVTAVSDFNLEIADKEFIVLVGPSGCGKSTTLRMVAGLEEISKGDLFIDDKRCNDVEPKDRDIAMVFQSYALYPHMTVRENMAFPLKLKKVPKAEIRKAVDEAAEILGITEYLERKPKALSGGQRQRVAIGRAIVREPKVLLMDEPLSNLDAKLRNQMRAEIIKLRQRINTTFIYVTHDQTEAMTLGDRIVIMKDGFVQQIGTPQEVFERPANLFVAGFIGMPQMNFFDDAELADGKLSIGGAIIELPADMAAKVAGKSGKVIAGVRPTHVKLAESAAANTVAATVDVSEMMGSEIHLHVNAGGKDVVLVLPTTDLPAAWRGGIPYGTTIYFTFPGELVQLFDPKTEENLLLPQMNYFDDAELTGDGKVVIQGATIELPADMAAKVAGKSGKVIAGVRPTHVKLAESAAANTVAATVDVSEMMGSEIHLHVNAGGKDVVLVLPTTDLPAAWRGGIPCGTTIYFTFPGELVQLFDPETENTLL